MAKKVFYNRRYKMPAWGQPYAVWAVIALVVLAVVYLTSVERVSDEPVASMPLRQNGFSEGLFYELREADAGEQYSIIRDFAARLQKRHAYRVHTAAAGDCRSITLVRGNGAPWPVMAALQENRVEGLYSVLVFLDIAATAAPAQSVTATLVFPGKGCDLSRFLQGEATTAGAMPVFVDAGTNTVIHYNKIPELRNLALRRHFPTAFLMKERTRWANILAMVSHAAPQILTVTAEKWSGGPAQALASNPLQRHPLFSASDHAELMRPVALYLGESTQLGTGGFHALCFLVWLLAALPLANALGVFRERFDFSSAVTSGFLYAVAFLSYLLIYRAILKFAPGDLVVMASAVILVPTIYFPLRILQKSMLRAELNRPGLHVLIQATLTVTLFLAPVSALIGLLQLAAASGYSRARIGAKLLRLLLVMAPLAVLLLAAREPMGTFANFLSAYLPALNSSGVSAFILLCLVGGNLTALMFVPRERI